MAEPAQAFDDVVEIVRLVCASGGVRFHLGTAAAAFQRMSGRGVSIGPASPRAVWDESLMDATEQERTAVIVDVRRVVEEGLAGWGYTVAADSDACLRLSHKDLPPESCAVLLPLRSDVSALDLRSRSTAPLIVRLYTGDEPPPAQIAVERTLGVIPVRLRDLQAFGTDSIAMLAATAATAAAAYGISNALPTAATLAVQAAPDRVIEYATTANASAFENATAQILDGLCGLVLPLGARLAGVPVPDGMVALVPTRASTKTRAALYDCKSKDNAAHYSLSPKDGDQFARYNEILDRCEGDGWQAEGLLVATSDVDAATLSERMTKEIWSRLKRRKLVFVPARILERWHTLSSDEGPAFRGRIDVEALWVALWHQELAGIPERRLARYFPNRDLNYRVLSMPEGEIVWLAGAAKVAPAVATAFAHLQRVSEDDRIEPHKKPHIIDRVIALLGRVKNVEIEDIARDTGLSEPAVEYLIESRSAFGDISPDDIGDNFAANRTLLRAKISAA